MIYTNKETKYGKKLKPKYITECNKYMKGVNRDDQYFSYLEF